jgi:hypothetical protein
MKRIERAGAIVNRLRRGLPRSWSALFLAFAHLTGCAQYGPDAMRTSRLAYNDAVQASEQREILLNLVRLRYVEAPEFLAINGISTQMRFEVGASIGAEFGEVENDDTAVVSPGAAVGYSETPTITFTPQRGQAFTRQLVAPVEMDSLYLLTHYGWGIDRVLLLIAKDLNGVDNTISREADRQSFASLRDFTELVTRMRRLEAERLIRVNVQYRREELSAPIPIERVSAESLLKAVEDGHRLELQDDPPAYVLTSQRAHYVLNVDRKAWDHPDFQAISNLLGLSPQQEIYEIDPPGNGDGNGLRLNTRSVLGTMAYLSNAVSVPPEHEGFVNQANNLNSVLKDLIDVRVSATPVEHAYLTVPHRGFWFYIDDRDVDSKRTLGLLTSLIRLTITAGGAQNVPILTLPVTG